MKRWHILLLDAVLLAAVPLGNLLTNWMLAVMPPCFVLEYGLLCPVCGGTRCVRFITEGNFLSALKMNPYIFGTVLLVGLGVLLLNLWAATQNRHLEKLTKKLLNPRWVIYWAIGLMAFGVLRNLLIRL